MPFSMEHKHDNQSSCQGTLLKYWQFKEQKTKQKNTKKIYYSMSTIVPAKDIEFIKLTYKKTITTKKII